MLEPVRRSLPDGVEILVPREPPGLTSYVLLEQGDWFEADLAFVRRILQPGDTVVDVGACLGVYALSAAARVGPGGRVLAIEPSPEAAELLRRSAARNGYAWLEVIEAAAGNAEGQVELRTDLALENRAVGPGAAGSLTARVPQTTLDAALASWQRLDLLKVDAEGAEVAVLEGGSRAIARWQPLLLCERRHGSRIDSAVPEQLRGLGATPYRLAPGLGLLVPATEALDDFQINLFGCPPTRASALERRQLLTRTIDPPPVPTDDRGWRARQETLKYAKSLPALRSGGALDADYDHALRHLAASRVATEPADRAGHLLAACDRLESLCATRPTVPRLHTLARAAAAWGRRMVAVEALRLLGKAYDADPNPRLDEPLWVCWPRFDEVAPRGDLGRWGLAAAVEAFETLQHFSSYWTADGSRRRLALFARLGFPSEAMARRREALAARAVR